jgi:hypothetical protein
MRGLGEAKDMLGLAHVHLDLKGRAKVGASAGSFGPISKLLHRHLELGHNLIMSSEHWGDIDNDNTF